MNIILDTHIAIWAISNHPMLTEKARKLILDPDNTIYFSSVSVWEVLLKHDSPKNGLTLTPDHFVEYCEESGYYQLNMASKHVLTAAALDISKVDREHRDPFDRLLLAQAKAENYSFLTHDGRLLLYNEKCVIKV